MCLQGGKVQVEKADTECLLLEGKHMSVKHIGFIVRQQFNLVKILTPPTAKISEIWGYWLCKFQLFKTIPTGGLF